MGTEDIGLSSDGTRQCALAAGALAPMGIGRIATSPLRRARESASIVAETLGLPVEEHDALEEVRFGDWQGGTYEEIAKDPRYLAFVEDPETNRTPGGETIGDVQGRGLDALAGIEGDDTVLVVSHGDIIRTLLCSFLGLPVREFRRVRVDNAGLSAVSTEGGSIQVRFINMLADPERAWDAVHWSSSR